MRLPHTKQLKTLPEKSALLDMRHRMFVAVTAGMEEAVLADDDTALDTSIAILVCFGCIKCFRNDHEDWELGIA